MKTTRQKIDELEKQVKRANLDEYTRRNLLDEVANLKIDNNINITLEKISAIIKRIKAM